MRVIDVQEVGEDDTWCTTVPTMGAFVASGIVVSNSALYTAQYAARGRKGIPRRRDEVTPEHEEGAQEMRGQYGYGDMWQ